MIRNKLLVRPVPAYVVRFSWSPELQSMLLHHLRVNPSLEAGLDVLGYANLGRAKAAADALGGTIHEVVSSGVRTTFFSGVVVRTSTEEVLVVDSMPQENTMTPS